MLSLVVGKCLMNTISTANISVCIVGIFRQNTDGSSTRGHNFASAPALSFTFQVSSSDYFDFDSFVL